MGISICKRGSRSEEERSKRQEERSKWEEARGKIAGGRLQKTEKSFLF